MRYVLLKLTDEGADKFIGKAGKKVVGVWDIPEKICECPEKQRNNLANWKKDPETEQPTCIRCGGVSKPFLSVGARLKMALGKNLIKLYR